MDYEQKYKQLHKFITDLYPHMSEYCKEKVEGFFPELAESKDERVRKAILELVKQSSHILNPMNQKSMIAWLEKQGKHGNQHLYDIIIALWDLLDKIDTFADLQIDDTDPDNPFRKIEHITQERHKFVKSDGYNLYIEGEQITDFQEQNTMMFNSTKESKCEENDSSTACLEKQDEQKAESKFKAGDWIISSEGTLRHIVAVDKTGYQTDNGWLTHDKYEKTFHLWTIKDAKAGDVLSYNDGHGNDCIELIKSITSKKIEFWFCLTNNEIYEVFDGICPYTNMTSRQNATPATKEQRDTLFAKMQEAGFIWDAEEKELKKIEKNPQEVDGKQDEQKPTEWSKQQVVNALTKWLTEEIASIRKKSLDGTLTERYEMFEAALLEMRSFVNSSDFQIGKDTSAEWSEEDEQMLQKALSTIRYALLIPIDKEDDPCFIGSSTISWLKSLKDRVQPQPKQEWSEKDEDVWRTLLFNFEDMNPKYLWGGEENCYAIDIVNFLKSLKDRVQPQPKQEWSEHDKTQLSEAIQMIEANGTWIRSEDAVKKVSNWLKSLKDRVKGE